MLQPGISYLNVLRPEGHRVQTSALRGVRTIHHCLFVSISAISPLVPVLPISDSFKSSSDVLNVCLKQLIVISYCCLCPSAWVVPLSPSCCSPDLLTDSNIISPFHLYIARLTKPRILIASLWLLNTPRAPQDWIHISWAKEVWANFSRWAVTKSPAQSQQFFPSLPKSSNDLCSFPTSTGLWCTNICWLRHHQFPQEEFIALILIFTYQKRPFKLT